MAYRPPLSYTWRRISIFILVIFGLIVLGFLIQIINQKSREKDLRKSKVSGILVDKRDLNRGSFLIILETANQKREYVLEGYDLYYDKYSIGDSLVKELNSFRFKVYRDTNKRGFVYLYTISQRIAE